jgi:hypothetical protein
MAASPAALAPAAPEKKLEGLGLYSRFAFAGAVCCSVTHGAFTPVDVYVVRQLQLHCLVFATSDAHIVSRRGSSSTRPPTTVV